MGCCCCFSAIPHPVNGYSEAHPAHAISRLPCIAFKLVLTCTIPMTSSQQTKAHCCDTTGTGVGWWVLGFGSAACVKSTPGPPPSPSPPGPPPPPSPGPPPPPPSPGPAPPNKICPTNATDLNATFPANTKGVACLSKNVPTYNGTCWAGYVNASGFVMASCCDDLAGGVKWKPVTGSGQCTKSTPTPPPSPSPPSPSPGPAPSPPQYYECNEKIWTCHSSAYGYNTSASCQKGCERPPPPPSPPSLWKYSYNKTDVNFSIFPDSVTVSWDGTAVYTPSLDLSVEPSINTLHGINATNGVGLWTFLIPGGQPSGAPLLSPDGKIVYLAVHEENTVSSGRPSKLIAIDAGSGIEQWEFITGDLGITPALSSDGTTAYTTWSGNVGYDERSNLTAINAKDGSVRWVFACVMEGQTAASPVLSPDEKFLYLINQQDIYGINAADGTQIWKFTNEVNGSDFPTGGPTLSPDGNSIYYVTSFFLVCLRASDGIELWTVPTASGIVAFSKDGRSIFMVGATNVTSYDLASSGSMLWSVNVSSPATYTNDTFIMSSTVSQDTTMFYAVESVDGTQSDSSILHAINTSNGSLMWSTAGGDYFGWNVVANPNGATVYIGGSGDNSITSLNAKDGRQKWDFQFGPSSNQGCIQV